MNRPNLGRASTMSRRRILSLGVAAAGGFAGATIAGCTFPGGGVGGPLKSAEQSDSQFGNPRLFPSAFPTAIQRRIETIVDARGSIQGGVLQIEIDRDDIRDVKLRGTQIFPSFEINGALNFQSLGGNRVAMNSDLCLKSDELNPLIDQLLKHDIVFQAEHQHFYDFDPIVWFIHFRAVGDAETIARGCKAR